MKIGDQVLCPAANEKGLGVIVGRQKLFQHTYVEVFFAGSGETITVPESELLAVQSPEEVFRQQQFLAAGRFLLRLFNLQVQASYTGDNLQTDGQYKSRISKYFQDMPEQVRDLIEVQSALDGDQIIEKGQLNAERLAEAIYYEETLKLEDKIRQQEESRHTYFQARAKAWQRIAVDNIRNARPKELQDEMRAWELQSRKRRQLIPSLNCEQIAYVEFVS